MRPTRLLLAPAGKDVLIIIIGYYVYGLTTMQAPSPLTEVSTKIDCMSKHPHFRCSRSTSKVWSSSCRILKQFTYIFVDIKSPPLLWPCFYRNPICHRHIDINNSPFHIIQKCSWILHMAASFTLL